MLNNFLQYRVHVYITHRTKNHVTMMCGYLHVSLLRVIMNQHEICQQ